MDAVRLRDDHGDPAGGVHDRCPGLPAVGRAEQDLVALHDVGEEQILVGGRDVEQLQARVIAGGVHGHPALRAVIRAEEQRDVGAGRVGIVVDPVSRGVDPLRICRGDADPAQPSLRERQIGVSEGHAVVVADVDVVGRPAGRRAGPDRAVGPDGEIADPLLGERITDVGPGAAVVARDRQAVERAREHRARRARHDHRIRRTAIADCVLAHPVPGLAIILGEHDPECGLDDEPLGVAGLEGDLVGRREAAIGVGRLGARLPGRRGWRARRKSGA